MLDYTSLGLCGVDVYVWRWGALNGHFSTAERSSECCGPRNRHTTNVANVVAFREACCTYNGHTALAQMSYIKISTKNSIFLPTI